MMRTSTISLVLCLLTGALGCVNQPSEPGEDPEAAEARREVLAHLGENVILKTYQDFLTSAQALEEAVSAWQESGAEEDRQAAQEAWQATMELWQEAELYQVGPAGLMGKVVGGEDLRDEIYSWPLVNTCRIDQELVEQAYSDTDAFAAELANVKGLDALEYLLFVDQADNSCAPNSTINTDGSWAAISAEDLAGRRASYANTVATLLVRDGQELVDQWTGPDGFLAELRRAGLDSQLFPTTQEALNSLSDAMFYLEKETKDMKLAVPAGLSNCDTELCLDSLESHFAFRSKAHVLANLRGFRKLVVGGDDPSEPGFDDLLARIDAKSVSDDLVAQLDATIAAVEAIDGTLNDALQSDKQSVVDAFNALQGAMMQFKTQFITVLDLNLPQRAESDND